MPAGDDACCLRLDELGEKRGVVLLPERGVLNRGAHAAAKALECAAVNFLGAGDKFISLSCGAFGKRFREIALRTGAQGIFGDYAEGSAPRPEDAVELLTSPFELAGYKEAIMEAMYKGTKRNIESETDSKNAQVG